MLAKRANHSSRQVSGRRRYRPRIYGLTPELSPERYSLSQAHLARVA